MRTRVTMLRPLVVVLLALAGCASPAADPALESASADTATGGAPPTDATFSGAILVTTTTPATGGLSVTDGPAPKFHMPAGWPATVEVAWEGVAPGGLALVLFDADGNEVGATLATTSPLVVELPPRDASTKVTARVAVPDLTAGVQIDFEGRVTFG